MQFLMVEIFVCLVGAFVIGAVTSWILRGFTASRRIAANDELWIKESEQRRLHLVETEASLTAKSQELAALQHEREAQKATIARLEKEVTQVRTLQDAIAEARGKISELRPLTEQLDAQARAARMTEREVDLLRARLDDLNSLIHEQQEALDAKNQHIVALCKQIEDLEPLSAEIQLRNLTIAELQTRLRKSDKERKMIGGALSQLGMKGQSDHQDDLHSSRDDLKCIHGIGPKLERLLNKLGIDRFEQIAAWTSDDIDRVDEQLETFRGRIRRDDWLAQAKRLRVRRPNKPVALVRR